MFSNEKDFHVDKYLNRCNDKYIANSVKDARPEDRFVSKSEHPSKAMMIGYVGNDETAFSPIWVDGALDSTKYKSMLVTKVIPTLEATYGHGGMSGSGMGPPPTRQTWYTGDGGISWGWGGFWPKMMCHLT